MFWLIKFKGFKYFTVEYIKEDYCAFLHFDMRIDADPLAKVSTYVLTYRNVCFRVHLVDLGMTLLPGKLPSPCPSFFFCLLFVG